MVSDVMRIQRTALDASRFPPFPPALGPRLYEVLNCRAETEVLGVKWFGNATAVSSLTLCLFPMELCLGVQLVSHAKC